MKRSVRSAAAIVATGLVLVACGSAEDAAPATEPVEVASAPEAGTAADPTTDEGSDTEGTTATPADAGVEAVAPAGDGAGTSDSQPEGEVPPTDAPAAANEPTEAVIGGRAFAADLSAESDFAENILPDILVDDIRSGEKVNFRNIFPADRPVLIWAWAPH